MLARAGVRASPGHSSRPPGARGRLVLVAGSDAWVELGRPSARGQARRLEVARLAEGLGGWVGLGFSG